MLFSRKNEPHLNLNITIDTQRIQPSPVTTFLDFDIDRKINWKLHVERKILAATRAFFAINRAINSTWKTTTTQRREILNSTVESIVLYGCSVWACALRFKKCTKQLRSFQRLLTLATTNCFKSTATNALLILSGNLPLDLTILIRATTHMTSNLTVPTRLESWIKKRIPSATTRTNLGVTTTKPPWHDTYQEATIATLNASPSVVKKAEIVQLVHNIWEEEWRNSTTGNTTKRFFPSAMSTRPVFDRNIPYQVTQILTGHSKLNEYQHKIHKAPSAYCNCLTGIESVDHFLFHCPSFEFHRSRFKDTCVSTVNTWPPQLDAIPTHPELWTEFCLFILATKRLHHSR